MKRVICSKQARMRMRISDWAIANGKRDKHSVLLKIKDTDGHVLLKPTYLTSDFIEDELLRHDFPSWGIKVIKTIEGNPTVWVVDYPKEGL